MDLFLNNTNIKINCFEKELWEMMFRAFEGIDRERHSIFLTGGFIRDKLLGFEIRDYDFIIHASVFHKFVDNIRAIENDYEISNQRKYTLKSKLVKGDWVYDFAFKETEVQVKAFRNKLKVDSLKRDFTVNSLYYNVHTARLIDYHNGKLDIHHKTIKTVKSNKETFDESFDRFFRLVRLMVKGLSIDTELANYVKMFFFTEKYKQVDYGTQSVSLQLNRIFENKNTHSILRYMRQLCMLEFLHNPIKNENKKILIYNKMLDIVEKLDILLYNPVFENFVKDRFGNKMNYKRECSNIKKIAIAYAFLNKLLFSSFESLDEIGFKFKIQFKDDTVLEEFLNRHDLCKKENYMKYFNRRSKIPFLGVILIVERINKEEIKKEVFVHKVIKSKYMKALINEEEEQKIVKDKPKVENKIKQNERKYISNTETLGSTRFGDIFKRRGEIAKLMQSLNTFKF